MVAPHVVRDIRRGIARRGPARPRSITTVAPPSRRITPTAPMAVDTTTGASSPAFPMWSGRHWSISWAVLLGDGCKVRESVGTPATSGRAGRGHRALDADVDKYELTEKCQAVGCVRCRCKALRTGSSATPPQSARHVPRVGPSAAGTTQGPERPFKHSKTPAVVHRPAPLIGQHTRQVMQELLASALTTSERDTPTAPSGPRACCCPYIEETLR